MPLHDWTRVSAESYHGFHSACITELARSLNNGVLPPMPLFLDDTRYVNAPLNETYDAALTAIPQHVRRQLVK